VFYAAVPEAITAGTSEAEALDRAQDALTVALSSYLGDGGIAATSRDQAGDS
jgi:predicted RNase H-like HicB family nuclease